MSITTNPLSTHIQFAIIAFALIGGASFSINSISILEFSNEQYVESSASEIEDVGDIFDPNHPFQQEQKSTELKKTVKKTAKIATTTEAATEYVANLPDAGIPEISDGKFNGNTDTNKPQTSNNIPTKTTDSKVIEPQGINENIVPENGIIPNPAPSLEIPNIVSERDLDSNQVAEVSVCRGYCFPDTDGDGIDDRWDQCLNEPENFNGYADWDGCQETIPSGPLGWYIENDYKLNPITYQRT